MLKIILKTIINFDDYLYYNHYNLWSWFIIKKIIIIRKKGVQKIVLPLFKYVWRERLKYYYGDTILTYKVIQVRGWRSALLEKKSGTRELISFMFKWEKN